MLSVTIVGVLLNWLGKKLLVLMLNNSIHNVRRTLLQLIYSILKKKCLKLTTILLDKHFKFVDKMYSIFVENHVRTKLMALES